MADAVRLAAVTYSAGFQIDDFLSEVASRLRAENVKLGGAIQRNIPGYATPCSAMVLEDLASNDRTWISQDLGSQARGCRLDPHGLAKVAARLERTLNAGPSAVELLILNKFGKAEAEGTGLRSAMSRAVEGGIAVLTSVRTTYAEAWSEFHAGLATDLQPDSGLVLGWCRNSVRPIRAAGRCKAYWPPT